MEFTSINKTADKASGIVDSYDCSLIDTIPSTTTIEHLPKPSLSSTLKNQSNKSKRRSRYDKLAYYSHLINRQYMQTMKNVLFRMHKQISKMKRRTHRIEKMIFKQTQPVQPVIRIARLTKDQISTICSDDEIVHETISDDNNNEISIKSKVSPSSTKRLNKKNKKHQRHIWINNRQQPIDARRYCSICQYQFARRSNFVVHVRNVHNGRFPPGIDEQDQSLSGMNEENQEKHDQLISNVLEDKNRLDNMSNNQHEQNDDQVQIRTSTKSNTNNHPKVKCDICDKIYRADYLKKHKRRAHRDQDISSFSNENNNPNVEEKLSNDNSTSIDVFDNKRDTATPTTLTIADDDADDVPIRFRPDTTKTIVLAVTCLEGYQLECVDKFLGKFSSNVSQTTSIDNHTTHLITNDEKHELRSPLSMKLIEAIANHCYCVSYRWIIDCLKYDRLIDEDMYEIEGDDTETQAHGGPRRSRLIPSQHSLFQNMCFMIKCTEKSDIKMTNERLENLITTCGGQIITCVTQRLLNKYHIIVLCDMHYVSERRHNYDQCRQLGIQFVSSDWVLESILEYRQKPFSLFEEVPL